MSLRWSVVIPVYRHAKELVECLRSLEQQTRPVEEIIIVDDGSPEPIDEAWLRQQADIPVFTLLRLPKNQGAPAARNSGFRASRGEIILFLDADIRLEKNAIATWEAAFEVHPEAAFVYNAFRFGWKRFASQPFDLEALRQENYIHTSAPIRRASVPAFDQTLKKFQDWDLWLQIAANGGVGVYLPQELFTVSAREGKQHRWEMSRWLPAFVHRLPWKWSPWQPVEIRRYREARAILQKKWDLPTKPRPFVFGNWMLFLLGVEMLSAIVFRSSLANTGVACTFALICAIIAAKRPTLALSVLAVELIVGSKGALFNAFGNETNDGGVSLRILLFLGFFLGWSMWAWSRRTELLSRLKPLFLSHLGYGWLFCAIGIGAVQGILHRNAFFVADANAWGYWLLLIPVLFLADAEGERLQKEIWPALTAAISWLILKTAILFYLFSHAFPFAWTDGIYLWVRRTGVGELTRASGSVFRIFFQSHVYLVFGWLLLAWKRLSGYVQNTWRSAVLWAGMFAALCVSLSRSLFLGVFAGAICLFAASFSPTPLVVKRWGKEVLFHAIGAFALIAALAFFPLPHTDASLTNAFLARFDQQGAGITSRWQLLPVLWSGVQTHLVVGSGFGATLTYLSTDPRIIEKTGGLYTTYAFEWGWLAIWLKLGLLGVGSIAFFFFWFARRAAVLPVSERWLVRSGLIALIVIHAFTPYIDHPLGIGLLLGLEGWMTIAEKKKTRENGTSGGGSSDAALEQDSVGARSADALLVR